LEPELTPNSLLVSADTQAQFGQAKLNERLLPHILRGREYEDRDPARPSKPFIPQYPAGAQEKGVQGEVFVEFVVAPDGRARMPRILYAVPAGYFESTVRDSVGVVR
jgi:outer membrane biosynthesis protein TonB